MDVTDRKTYWIALAFGASLGGIYFVWTSIDYVWKYLTDTDAMYRGEYIQGAAIALLLSLPFWLLMSGLLYPARAVLTKRSFILLNVPTMVVTVVLAFLHMYVLYRAIFS